MHDEGCHVFLYRPGLGQIFPQPALPGIFHRAGPVAQAATDTIGPAPAFVLPLWSQHPLYFTCRHGQVVGAGHG